ncbi:MAG: prephenate dehydrogenase [Arcanobacterium sp.]|nr:prephenate dehydrogenase [Arcanobacterium sp.]
MNATALLTTTGPVLVIGAGLLGTSIALRLRSGGVEVHIQDASPVAAGLARDLGAGSINPVAEPQIVIVAVPPDVTAQVVRTALAQYPHAVVTDVASVKNAIATELADDPNISRWVGSHPMAGKERSGGIAADADLFMGRPWVIVSSEKTYQEAVLCVRNLATDMGASVIAMSAAQHDHVVAVMSHMPQLMSSLVGAALRDEPAQALDLAGQGLRDVTRIAHSDPLLWAAIIDGNRTEISAVLRGIEQHLQALIAAIESEGGLDTISGIIHEGNLGVARIPGKHGGAPAHYGEVTVLVPDEPGRLGQLFSDIGAIGVNIEDFSLEHSMAQPVGRAAVFVQPARTAELERGLDERGWQVVSTEREEE